MPEHHGYRHAPQSARRYPNPSPTAVEVFTSSDGAKWKSIGAVTISKSGTQYIKFSKAVETRYLKYYVKQGPNTVSLTEFDLYAK